MKKVKKIIKNNVKVLVGIIIGTMVTGTGVYAATVINASDVSFKNASSEMTSTNVQGAIEELNTKATTKIAEAKKECPDGYVCKTNQFANDSWATIATNIKSGNTSSYKVGDEKMVNMGSLGTHTVRVANMTSCRKTTSETACGFVVEFTDQISKHAMNSTDTNVGGWPASEMRTYLNETVYNALPSELQNVIANTKVVSNSGSKDSSNFTSTDKLYLLSVPEIFGTNNWDNTSSETAQLDYYSYSNTTTTSYLVTSKGSGEWWTRSALQEYYQQFYRISMGVDNATKEYGVSPAFRIA